jgi:hypothetical protein
MSAQRYLLVPHLGVVYYRLSLNRVFALRLIRFTAITLSHYTSSGFAWQDHEG